MGVRFFTKSKTVAWTKPNTCRFCGHNTDVFLSLYYNRKSWPVGLITWSNCIIGPYDAVSVGDQTSSDMIYTIAIHYSCLTKALHTGRKPRVWQCDAEESVSEQSYNRAESGEETQILHCFPVVGHGSFSNSMYHRQNIEVNSVLYPGDGLCTICNTCMFSF